MASPRLLKGRHSSVGAFYSITTVSHGRRRLFEDPATASLVATEIAATDRHGLSSTLAWVLMPDHLHWLCSLESGSLGALVQRFKMRSAQAINRTRHCHGAVWQAGFHDHRVRDEISLRNVARYLLENPIRAGLVSAIEEYPHAWCAWGEGKNDSG